MLFLKKEKTSKPELLMKKNILLNCEAATKEEAITKAGRVLVQSGYVTENYIEGMLAREKELTTAIGNYIAIPHGESQVKKEIIFPGLVAMVYPKGISWDDEIVHLVVGIAANGDEHLQILGNIVEKLNTPEAVKNMVENGDADTIYKIFCDCNKAS